MQKVQKWPCDHICLTGVASHREAMISLHYHRRLNIMQNQGYRVTLSWGALVSLTANEKKMLNSRGQPIRRRSLVSPGPC
jgi:hypothetical protein